MLDGGCGTGLCAPTLKAWASGLVGVDLSGAMLEKARQKQLYYRLVESELTHFLEQHGGVFDLAVYADTLCYFGDLQDVLRASAHALSSPGTLLFTLEALHFEDGARGFQLHPHGRYSHTPAYVRKTLQDCGFSQISIHTDSMRQEVGKPVEGLVVSARRLLIAQTS